MSERSFQPPPVPLGLSDSELQTRAERLLQRPRTLQELPLILVPPSLLDLPQEPWLTPPMMKSVSQSWLQEARLEDERLRIERRFIPHTPVYIPDTPEGQQFFKLAKAIGNIPLTVSILPQNQNQGYWLKTLHYHWQARGVVTAHRLIGVISDPLREDGVLRDRLSDKNLEYLRLSSTIDVACFHLLTHGENGIKRWAKKNKVAYPFETPCDLLLELLREEFLATWELGPVNSEKKPLSKAQQSDNSAVRVHLLKRSPWLMKETGNRQDYDTTEQAYLQYLRESNWNGYWLLALRPHKDHTQIDSYWKSYIQALSEGKGLFVNTLNWLGGEPFDRPTSNVHRSVEGTLDLLGYIHWSWI